MTIGDRAQCNHSTIWKFYFFDFFDFFCLSPVGCPYFFIAVRCRLSLVSLSHDVRLSSWYLFTTTFKCRYYTRDSRQIKYLLILPSASSSSSSPGVRSMRPICQPEPSEKQYFASQPAGCCCCYNMKGSIFLSFTSATCACIAAFLGSPFWMGPTLVMFPRCTHSCGPSPR